MSSKTPTASAQNRAADDAVNLPLRSLANINNGRWTRAMEAMIRPHFAALGLPYSEPEWPAQEEK